MEHVPVANGSENVWWFLGIVAFAVGAIFVTKYFRANIKTNEQVLHQVKNDHETNLRDDIDSVVTKLDNLIVRLDRIETKVTKLGFVDEDLEDTLRREKRDLALAVQERNEKLEELRREIEVRFNTCPARKAIIP